ncbi:MAG: AEC family transporter [Acutalibacteraceae bacterium]
MSIFVTVFSEFMVLFAFMAIGYILKKGNFVPENTATVLSRLENMIFMPAVIINTFMTRCTVKNFVEKSHLIIYGGVILLFCILLGVFLGRFFHRDKYVQIIYRYSISVSNFAFVGIGLVQGLFSEDILFDYLIFTLPYNIYTFSLGVAWLVPSKSGKFSFKSFLTPIFVSLIIGSALGLSGLELPGAFQKIVSGIGSCMSPVAMILTGIVIGSYPFWELLKNYKVYILSAIRLVAIPVFIMLMLIAFKAEEDIMLVSLCANAMPLGLNTVIIPASYGKDPRLGASLALVSELMAVFTIPLLFTIFGIG